jgi:putative transposase
MGHPPRIPMWLHWDQSVVYFIAICVADRNPILANKKAFQAFTVAVSKLRDWRVLPGIPMPDHIHVIVARTKEREAKLGNFSAALRRWMHEELEVSWKWQPGSFDRLLRSGESLHDKWLYIRENPVRAGLVQRWGNWPYQYEFNEETGKRCSCPTTLRGFDSVADIRFAQ